MKDNFEEHIKGIMNDPPDYAFEERLWKDVKRRMDSTKNGDGGGFIKYIPFLLLALLFSGICGFQYYSHQKAERRITFLESHLDQQKIVHIDTVIEKRVEIIYDTIYQKSVVFAEDKLREKRILVELKNLMETYSTKVAWLNQQLNSNRLPFGKSSKNDFNFRGKFFLSAYNFTNYQGLGIRRNDLNSNGNSLDENLDKKTDAKLYTANFDQLTSKNNGNLNYDYTSNSWVLEVQDLKRKKSIAYFVKKAAPSRFALSAFGGYARALNFSKKSHIGLGKIEAEMGYGKNFNLVIGGEYLYKHINLAIDNVNDGSDFPASTPNGPNDRLHEIYGDFNYLQIPFGLKYYFTNSSLFHPYCGGGLLMHKVLSSEMTYEFHGSTLEYSIEVEDVGSNAFGLDDYWATIGIRTSLKNRSSILFEVSSQFELGKVAYRFQDHQYLKFNLGWQYRL